MNYFTLIGVLFIGICESTAKGKKRAVIMQRPSDVTDARCGQEITMTCLAEGSPAPEVEWWYYDAKNKRRGAQKLQQGHRQGRVKIKVEEFTVVRSTVVVEGAEDGDVGVYQCRASNSAKRKVPGENVYKHWRIEEAPVIAVLCEDELESDIRQQTVALLKDIDDVTAQPPTTTEEEEIVFMTTEAKDTTLQNQTYTTIATKYFLREIKTTTHVSMETTTDGAKENESFMFLIFISVIMSFLL